MQTNYTATIHPADLAAGRKNALAMIETRDGFCVAVGTGIDEAAAMADLATQVVLHQCVDCGRELCSPVDSPALRCISCIIAGFGVPAVIAAAVSEPAKQGAPTPGSMPKAHALPVARPARRRQPRQGTALSPEQVSALTSLRKTL